MSDHILFSLLTCFFIFCPGQSSLSRFIDLNILALKSYICSQIHFPKDFIFPCYFIFVKVWCDMRTVWKLFPCSNNEAKILLLFVIDDAKESWINRKNMKKWMETGICRQPLVCTTSGFSLRYRPKNGSFDYRYTKISIVTTDYNLADIYVVSMHYNWQTKSWVVYC